MSFDGSTLTLAVAEAVVLQVHTRQHSGSQLEHCASVALQLNQLTCSAYLRAPQLFLGVTVTTVPAAAVADQHVQLSSADGDTVFLLGPLSLPDPSTGTAPVVPVLKAALFGPASTLHWDGETLELTAPPGLTARVLLRHDTSQEELPCEPVGEQVNDLSCPINARLSPEVSVDVRVPAGWNIVGAPGYTAPDDAGPLYTLPPGGTDYELVPSGAPLMPGVGYWEYHAAPAAPRPSGTAAPASVTRTVPPGQLVMVGNERQVPVCVRGATAVLVYDPMAGYVPNALLQPGQGAWAVSDTGSLSLDGYPATPCP